ncbi:RseA family anti-sigma factor [Psychromonas sp. MME2]|uniref:sigma-E factor negative regulatory protein n=1 Tax=unclassified Psychromonas TaxID=2614957 RepID=UPI00339D2A3D
MKENNEQLSAMIDNEAIDNKLIDELLLGEQQQALFSRYHLMGDVIRGGDDAFINIDVSDKVMAEINTIPSVSFAKTNVESISPQTKKSNVLSFGKRFAQYAIAASVAGVVLLTSFISSQPQFSDNGNGIEVLNTIPFGGGAAPVSLQTKYKYSQEEIKKYNERLDALLQDHQLQLQTQP